MNAFQRTAALGSALELDLFTAIGEGITEASALAGRCGASERGIRILADHLVGIELLSKDGSRYAPTPTSAAFLDRSSPTCLGETVRFINHPGLMEVYDDLTKVVRTERTALPGEDTVSIHNPV